MKIGVDPRVSTRMKDKYNPGHAVAAKATDYVLGGYSPEINAAGYSVKDALFNDVSFS